MAAARLRSLGETAHRHRDFHAAHHGFDRLVRSTRGTLAGRDMDKLRLVQVEVDLRQIDNALQGAASVLKHAKPCGEVACAASALQAQAFARLSKEREASRAIGQARESRLQPTPELPTLALAKAAFLAGSEIQAISLLRSAFAIRRDFRVRQSMDKVLADTERQHVAQQIFVPAATDDWAAFRNPVFEEGHRGRVVRTALHRAAMGERPEMKWVPRAGRSGGSPHLCTGVVVGPTSPPVAQASRVRARHGAAVCLPGSVHRAHRAKPICTVRTCAFPDALAHRPWSQTLHTRVACGSARVPARDRDCQEGGAIPRPRPWLSWREVGSSRSAGLCG